MIDKRELLLASLWNQHMLEKAGMADIVSNLCGLQAQFANNPAHALRFRAHDFDPVAWKNGLVKTWTFRRTIHVVRRDELGLFLSAADTPAEWNDDWGLDRSVKPELVASLMKWIRRGVGDREDLKARCRAIGVDDETLSNVFHGWGGLLKEMSQRGMVAYAPGTEKRFIACGRVRSIDRDKARSIVLKRYFRHLGPATLADCAAFTGYARREIDRILALHPLRLRSIVCEGKEYLHLGKLNTSGDIPPCLFLAGFDQLIMAYKDRSRLVDEKHKNDIVTNTGIVHPTVLVGGRLKAKWKKDGKSLIVTPFASLTKRERSAVDETGLQVFGGDIEAVLFQKR